MWSTVWRYVKSTAVTFVAGFAIVVAPQLESLSLDSVTDGALVGLVFAGARLGIKMVLELYLTWYNSGK